MCSHCAVHDKLTLDPLQDVPPVSSPLPHVDLSFVHVDLSFVPCSPVGRPSHMITSTALSPTSTSLITYPLSSTTHSSVVSVTEGALLAMLYTEDIRVWHNVEFVRSRLHSETF